MSPKELTAQLGQKVELTCEVRVSTSQGCSWLFQDRNSVPPKLTFIAYVPSRGQTKLGERQDSQQFSAKKNGDKYILTLSKFRKGDEGYYFCSAISNSVMHFSPLVPVFLPGLDAEIPPGCWGSHLNMFHTQMPSPS